MAGQSEEYIVTVLDGTIPLPSGNWIRASCTDVDDWPYDEVVAPWAAGFPFFGVNRPIIRISPNGELNLGDGIGQCCSAFQTPYCAFGSGGPGTGTGAGRCTFDNSYTNIIGALISDFNPSVPTASPPPSIQYQIAPCPHPLTTQTCIYVRWYRVPLFWIDLIYPDISDVMTFMTVLYPSGRIAFSYESVFDPTWLNEGPRPYLSAIRPPGLHASAGLRYLNEWSFHTGLAGNYPPFAAVRSNATNYWWPITRMIRRHLTSHISSHTCLLLTA